ncbi:MAG TPA: KUP/HAK/KT family potassium transporter, partial [Steroidobacteraceae bacterium]|nr:KUP/HAK/KT family potassium transporter [Steroidobacteraceae bacterium]
AALGVVFGDIGTSPYYALRECFALKHGIAPSPDNVLGVLSLILWSMMLIISLQYVAIIMKSDNRGEGGVLALSALLLGATRNWKFWTPISVVGLFGAALFFGDGFITPPVSILGAMEGLTLIDEQLGRIIVPGTMIILVVLFSLQKRGTGAMGAAFGPVMMVWFVVLGVLGAAEIIVAPQVIWAVNPYYAFEFFANNGFAGFAVMSSVFLTVTGGEALYADMGHFGRLPIRNAWRMIVLPALALNYFGQGALLLSNPAAVVNPFFLLAPTWALVPLILLAVAAAVIASQAVISGVFSVTRQAINLGYLPRLKVLHSSEEEIGQVYLPAINWMLFAGAAILTVGFGSSSALAGAYGIAVSSTMLIDAIMVILLLRFTRSAKHHFKIGVLAFIVLLNILFVASNSLKFPDGGWLPITVAIGVFLLMSAWSEGRRNMAWLVAREQTPLRDFLAALAQKSPPRVSGTAVYLTSDASGIPRALTENLRFHQVIHERVIFLSFVHPDVPRVPVAERIQVENISEGIHRVIARYGFMETPNVIAALRAADDKGVPFKPEETLYVVGHDNPVITRSSGMALWRKRLYALMNRNSQLAAVHYGVPPHRVYEVGSQVKL